MAGKSECITVAGHFLCSYFNFKKISRHGVTILPGLHPMYVKNEKGQVGILKK